MWNPQSPPERSPDIWTNITLLLTKIRELAVQITETILFLAVIITLLIKGLHALGVL